MNSHYNPDYVPSQCPPAYLLPYTLETTTACRYVPHQIYKHCNGKHNHQKTYDYCCRSGTNADNKKYPADEFNPWKNNSGDIYGPVGNYLIAGNGFCKLSGVVYLVHAGIDKEPPNIKPEYERKMSMRKDFFNKKYRFHGARGYSFSFQADNPPDSTFTSTWPLEASLKAASSS